MNNVEFKKIISIGLVATTIFIAVPQRAFASSTDTASASKADSKSYKVSAGISAADAYDSAIKAKNIAEAYTDYASSDVVLNFNKAFQQLDQAYYYAGIAYTSERSYDASNASILAYNSALAAYANFVAADAAANKNSQFADYVFVKAAHAAYYAANAAYYVGANAAYAAAYADATATAAADTKTAASTADAAIAKATAAANAAADAAKIKSDATDVTNVTNVTNATDKTATLVAPALGDSSKSGTTTIAIPVPGKTPAPSTSAQLSTQLGTIAPKTKSKTNVLSSTSQQEVSQNLLTLFR